LPNFQGVEANFKDETTSQAVAMDITSKSMPHYDENGRTPSMKFDSVLDIQAKIEEESENETPAMGGESGKRSRTNTISNYTVNPFKTPVYRHSKTSEDV
jgi:hypothetical protein